MTTTLNDKQLLEHAKSQILEFESKFDKDKIISFEDIEMHNMLKRSIK